MDTFPWGAVVSVPSHEHANAPLFCTLSLGMCHMQLGFHLTPFFSPPERSATQILDEVITVVRAASSMGYAWVSTPHHWLSYPTVWPQPYPLVARLAPEIGAMRIKTSVLLLPLLNAVDVAENIATLDHLTHGRLTLGVAIGYREEELQVLGLTRRDRVPKFEESLQVMKRLWAGEEVTFTGKYVTLHRARLGFGPYQLPHPPIEVGAQSPGAVRRAARLADGIFLGPQVAWRDLRELVDMYTQERQQAGHQTVGIVGASRSLIVGRNKHDAASKAHDYVAKTFANYQRWHMQERTMVPLQLDFASGLDAWTIHGSPQDCVETILQARDEIGLEYIGFTIYSLPVEVQARIDYLQMIAEDIVAQVARA
jgi:alkanesulfonate monooxygenase SsuD/methylene tetrahydromethanopterin reductase-like flavin-dependent oxidoreductase (luciferase family)